MRVTSLAQFQGKWRLERHIHDHLAGVEGTLAGEAVFAPVAGGLAYAETGTLRYAGQAPLRAERRYHWAERAGRVVVFFEDCRPFHDFPLGAVTAEAHHLCAPDSYAVHYDFTGFPDWQATWRATGPRKRNVMISRYTPAG